MITFLATWSLVALVAALALGQLFRRARDYEARERALRQLRTPIAPLPRVLRFVGPHSVTAARGPIRRRYRIDGDAA